MSVSSSSSSSSGWTQTSSRASGATTRYRDRKLPNTTAVNLLKYFTGRDPRKIRSIRVYETTWPDDCDMQSVWSGWSGYSSWSAGKQIEVTFLESRGAYYYDGWDDDEPPRRRKPKKKSGPPRRGAKGRHSSNSSDSGDDDSMSESSGAEDDDDLEDMNDAGRAPQFQGRPPMPMGMGMGGMGPGRGPPGMMPGGARGPFPPGRPAAFGGMPRPPQAFSPRPGGFGGPPPPPPPPAPVAGGMPGGPPGPRFMRGPVQGWDNN